MASKDIFRALKCLLQIFLINLICPNKRRFSKKQNLMQERTCWTKMMSSINFFHKKNKDSKAQTSKLQSKQVKIAKSSKKTEEKGKSKFKAQSISSPTKKSVSKRTLDEASNTKTNPNQTKKPQNPITPVEEEPGQTQRNCIESQIYESDQGPEDEHSLPTEKSDIIMNDVGRDIDKNENNFLYDENYDKSGNFSEVYQKIKLIKSSVVYDEYLVKKKTTGQTRRAYLMRPYETLIKQWNISEEEAIEKYSDLYEREKHHIKNLVALTKKNCRHLVKLLDYELRPPTINTNDNNQFTPGSVAVVFEILHSTLEEYLLVKSKNLSRLDKKVLFSLSKKLIYEICACMSDIHGNNFTVKNLSLHSFGLDKFGSIIFQSLQVQESEAKFYHSDDIRDKNDLIYSPPEELQTQVKTDRMAQNKTYFHSGFSQISDFDKTESSPEKQDLWKLGVVAARILSGKFPFSEQTAKEQKEKIREMLQNRESTTGSKSLLHQKLCKLSPNETITIESLLKKNPNERLSCKQILASQYLTNILDDSFEQQN